MYLLVLPGPKTIRALTDLSITNDENITDLEVVKDIRNSISINGKSTIFGQKTLDFHQEILKK